MARRYAEFAIAHGRIPFSDFGPVPQRFHEMYVEFSRQPNGPGRREFKIPYPNPHRASAPVMHDEAIAFELAAA